MEPVIIICVIVVVLFAAIMAILSRYRKCPSDKVLVIYGKVGTDKNGQARYNVPLVKTQMKKIIVTAKTLYSHPKNVSKIYAALHTDLAW